MQNMTRQDYDKHLSTLAGYGTHVMECVSLLAETFEEKRMLCDLRDAVAAGLMALKRERVQRFGEGVGDE